MHLLAPGPLGTWLPAYVGPLHSLQLSVHAVPGDSWCRSPMNVSNCRSWTEAPVQVRRREGSKNPTNPKAIHHRRWCVRRQEGPGSGPDEHLVVVRCNESSQPRARHRDERPVRRRSVPPSRASPDTKRRCLPLPVKSAGAARPPRLRHGPGYLVPAMRTNPGFGFCRLVPAQEGGRTLSSLLVAPYVPKVPI